MIFDIEMMAEDFRRVGYSEKTIEESKIRWEKHNGKNIIHINNFQGRGVISGTELNVLLKWCRRESDEVGKSNKVAIIEIEPDYSKKDK